MVRIGRNTVKYMVLVTGLVISTATDAHCYSVWRYPWPQRCGHGFYPSKHIGIPDFVTPLPPAKDIEFPLPALDTDWFNQPEVPEDIRARLLLRAALQKE
jgi:hypothetical protein